MEPVSLYTVSLPMSDGCEGFYMQTSGLFEGSIWYFTDAKNAVHIAGAKCHQPFQHINFEHFDCASDLWKRLDIKQMKLL